VTKGLTTAQVRQRGTEKNTLRQKKRTPAVVLFAGQFRDVLILILLAGAAISALLGELTDAVTIILIVLLNAILGFVQEYRTEKTLEALTAMTAPTARVYRDGTVCVLPAAELVTGDLVVLEAGDRVPADCTVRHCRGLQTDESILTGETVPVSKSTALTEPADNAFGQESVLYGGTTITAGNAEAEIIAVGEQSQIGKISGMLSDIDAGQTPLQQRLGILGKQLGILCIIVCIVVFLAGVARGEPVFDMLMTGITIAIAAIREGLPATVTIALALAVRRMLKANALVRKLHAVETLGCASVICTDKTGTITENRMTVTRLFVGAEQFDVLGHGYRIAGELRQNDTPIQPKSFPALTSFFRCAVLCSHAKIHASETKSGRQRGRNAKGSWEAVGDPTEIALLIAAEKAGVSTDTPMPPLIDEQPFDSATKRMAVLVQEPNGKTVYIKGALDVLLPMCGFYQCGTEVLPLTQTMRQKILLAAEDMAHGALRVLALAQKQCARLEDAQSGLTFLGLCGMVDPLRAEAKRAIALCHKANIRTVMITGDHPATAKAIAEQAGLLRGRKLMTGAELDRLSDDALRASIDNYAVFARVNPAHKLRLVRAFRARGEVVTMTGDGVNDAPAIKEADVGVAMGKTGTDVTKQAADVILLDDNFATLVNAVEQGRCIYANIRKFVRYLLSCNIGEVITMFFGILIGMPPVLLPVQLLLVNLVTDGLPAIALGLEPPEQNTMHRPPRRRDDSFFSEGLFFKIVLRGVLIGLCTLGCFSVLLRGGAGLDGARTGALITLILSQLIHVFECKSEHGTLFSVSYHSNGKLLLAVLFSLLCLIAVICLPALAVVFRTVILTRHDLLTAIGFSLAVPVLSGIGGVFQRKN